MAVEIPWLIPFMTSSHSKPRICSQKMSKAMTVKTGICGDRPKPMTPQPSMTSIKNKNSYCFFKTDLFVHVFVP